eukprot:scaffold5329_cov126-Skeletonema_marinoi.AAC.9
MPSLQLVAIPLNCVIEKNVFYKCSKLATVDLVGGIHNTVASLHLESWRNEMRGEINRINQALPSMLPETTAEIQQWMESDTRRLNHYSAEHHILVKEATTYWNSPCGRPILITTTEVCERWKESVLRGEGGREQGRRSASHLVRV